MCALCTSCFRINLYSCFVYIYACVKCRSSGWGTQLTTCFRFFTTAKAPLPGLVAPTVEGLFRICREYLINKTQCRLCKRLAGPIIPFSVLVWSGKSVLPIALITKVQSTTTFLCARQFWHVVEQTTDQPM